MFHFVFLSLFINLFFLACSSEIKLSQRSSVQAPAPSGDQNPTSCLFGLCSPPYNPPQLDFSAVPTDIIEGVAFSVSWSAFPSDSYDLSYSKGKDCTNDPDAQENMKLSSYRFKGLARGEYTVCLSSTLNNVKTPAPMRKIVVKAPEIPADRTIAKKLSETGLYKPNSNLVIADHNRPYEPKYPFWSDGLAKKRWVYLPFGAKIATNQPDDWVFPVGTTFWKEFSDGATKVETRMITKTSEGEGPAHWYFATYVWNSDATDAILDERTNTDAALIITANTIADTIPKKSECNSCHRGVTDFVLGFSRLQIRADVPVDAGEVGYDRLVEVGSVDAAVKPAKIACDVSGSEILGYFHANCSHCHYSASFSLRHRGDPSHCVDEPAYIALTSGDAMARIKPGLPDESIVFQRISATGSARMPKLGSQIVDEAFKTKLRAWIMSLPGKDP